MWSPTRQGGSSKPLRQWSTTASGIPNTHIPNKGRLRVGQRACLTSNTSVVGTVRFVGEIEGRGNGTWIGLEWDDLTSGDFDGRLNGRVLFQLSQRAQRSARTAASLCRESELTVNEHIGRAENAPLIVDPRYDCYDWAVSPRDTYQGRFLMAMREFMCCGAMCHVRAPDPQHRYRPLHPHRRLTDVMALFCEGERGFAQSSAVASACTFLSEAEQLTWGSCRELHSGDIPYATYLPDDEDDLRPLGVPSTADLVRIATVAGRYIGVGVPLNRETEEGAELRSMKPPSARRFSDTGD